MSEEIRKALVALLVALTDLAREQIKLTKAKVYTESIK